MNAVVFHSFWNPVVSTVTVIHCAHQMEWIAYIESCINVGTYNLRHCCIVPINHEFTRSCLCVNVTRNKESSWYDEHMNEKCQNVILIWSHIFTLQYHPSYVCQYSLDTVQYIINDWYNTIGVMFIIKHIDVVYKHCIWPHFIYIRINVHSNRIENQSSVPW